MGNNGEAPHITSELGPLVQAPRRQLETPALSAPPCGGSASENGEFHPEKWGVPLENGTTLDSLDDLH